MGWPEGEAYTLFDSSGFELIEGEQLSSLTCSQGNCGTRKGLALAHVTAPKEQRFLMRCLAHAIPSHCKSRIQCVTLSLSKSYGTVVQREAQQRKCAESNF